MSLRRGKSYDVLLRRGMIVLATAGLALAAYLTYVHYAGIKPVCTAGGSCIKVQTSQWSRLDGVPVALIGLIGYVGILASLLFPDREESRLATLALTLIGFAFSAYLTYRELYSIHAVCEECATSAVILTVLFVGALVRYLLGPGAASAPVVSGPPVASRAAGTSQATGTGRAAGKSPATGKGRAAGQSPAAGKDRAAGKSPAMGKGRAAGKGRASTPAEPASKSAASATLGVDGE